MLGTYLPSRRSQSASPLRLHVLTVLMSTTLAILPFDAATAQSAPQCSPGQNPELGYAGKQLRAAIGDVMGEPTSSDYKDPGHTGDSLQDTTTGLIVYRISTSARTFTNGSEWWALTARRGVLYWVGDEI